MKAKSRILSHGVLELLGSKYAGDYFLQAVLELPIDMRMQELNLFSRGRWNLGQ